MEFKLSYSPAALPFLPKSSFRCEMAFCAFPLYSSSRVTKRLPIMAPDAWEQAVSNETYHAWIAQVHILNLLEIDLFPGVEIFLRAGGGC